LNSLLKRSHRMGNLCPNSSTIDIFVAFQQNRASPSNFNLA
jgi:hypothetical protein